MRYDAQLVIETEGTLDRFREVPAEVLLLGGSRSPAYLKRSLDALASVLPAAPRLDLAGVGHVAPDNSGRPLLVAEQLATFFTSSGCPAHAKVR